MLTIPTCRQCKFHWDTNLSWWVVPIVLAVPTVAARNVHKDPDHHHCYSNYNCNILTETWRKCPIETRQLSFSISNKCLALTNKQKDNSTDKPEANLHSKILGVSLCPIYTDRQRSWGKVIFSQACVCPQGMGIPSTRSLPGDGYVQRVGTNTPLDIGPGIPSPSPPQQTVLILLECFLISFSCSFQENVAEQ